MSDHPAMVCVAITPTVYWHVPVLGHTDDGHPLVHVDSGVLDVTTLGLPWLQYQPLDGYDETTTRHHAQKVLYHLIDQEGTR